MKYEFYYRADKEDELQIKQKCHYLYNLLDGCGNIITRPEKENHPTGLSVIYMELRDIADDDHKIAFGKYLMAFFDDHLSSFRCNKRQVILALEEEAKAKITMPSATVYADSQQHIYEHAILSTAITTCYSDKHPDASMSRFLNLDYDAGFHTRLMRCLDSGHYSVMEHMSYTFSITCSRACSHQLVRHRIAQYSQQSQRHVSMDSVPVIIPPAMSSIDKLFAYLQWMNAAGEMYNSMILQGIPMEDARYVLPAAVATNIVVTMNLRSIAHFLQERCCSTAQSEIRMLAQSIRDQLQDDDPLIFNHPVFDAKCVSLGYCTEGTRGCGRFPCKEDVLKGGSRA